MKIAILHQRLEWAEPEIARALERKGHACTLVPLEVASLDTLARHDVVLNRVYASVANRCWPDIGRALSWLAALEARGVRCVNNLQASQADYDKHLAAGLLARQGVSTPPTLRLRHRADVEAQAATLAAWGWPRVLKRATGGRGVDVRKLDNEADWQASLHLLLDQGGLGQYGGALVVQPFLVSRRPHDLRIAIVNDQLAYAWRRSLVATQAGGPAWLGSVSAGSTFEPHEPSPAEIALAQRATRALGADINEVDMLDTPEGLTVIENNPTPGYIEGDEIYVNGLVDALANGDVFKGKQPPSLGEAR